MIDEKKKELLRKLQALAERGEAGERDVARQRLAELMEKYNVSAADLSDDTLEEHEFRYQGKFQKQLLVQLKAKNAPDRATYRYIRGKGKNSIWIIKCTKAEALQIRIEYEFFCRLWDEEVEFFLDAFIQKHRLFDTRPGSRTTEIDDETMFRLSNMMRGMQDKSLLPMIEGRV